MLFGFNILDMSIISTVVVTFNEAEKLDRCLSSVADFSDECVVVDLGSTDHTQKVVSKYGAKLIKHDHVDIVEKIRNFSIDSTKGEWVLLLDPDETVSDDLKNYLKKATLTTNVAYNIPRKNIIFGKWISHTNFWPDYQIRFFKKGHVTWSENIHSYPRVEGSLIQLPGTEKFALEHRPYRTVEEFISRTNRYTSQNQKYTNPAIDFFKRYIWHRGFLDGSHGLAISYLMVIYQICVWVKYWEKKA